MAVGDRIKRVRQFRGLTQKELGKLVGWAQMKRRRIFVLLNMNQIQESRKKSYLSKSLTH